ncbi:MAG: NHLP leader peptide family natural product precursor [bacterium]|nr:NHLP leader peptide family natural product precursor [bacterium]
MDRSESLKRWDRLVAQAWADDTLKQQLVEDPATVLKEHGLEVPADVEIRVVENTDRVHYLTLPARPAEGSGELTDRQMESVAGGWVDIKDWDEVPLGVRLKKGLGGLGT